MALVVLASLPLLSAAFCEAGETVTYRNETAIALVMSVEGEGDATIPAESTERYGYIMPTDDPFRLRVTDVTGCVVFSLDTTLRELKADRDLTITIREADVSKCKS
ncbi:MAG: hypothetical protein IIC86_08030 [Chloroflexi bacterium]|nr:hypothetical protein [Chloroflexota bacterium]